MKTRLRLPVRNGIMADAERIPIPNPDETTEKFVSPNPVTFTTGFLLDFFPLGALYIGGITPPADSRV
ncbi:MAG: hypothetical protein AB2693_20485 [Candidatus Thiodiazotropha sp.]